MDKNYSSHVGIIGKMDLGDLLPEPGFAPWSDTLKLSAARYGDVTVGAIHGGREDCIDINNGCRGLTIEAARLYSGGTYVATIKGGSEDIELRGVITRHGSVVDVDLDNYSDQSHAPCRNIRLHLATLDGSPVTWRSWRGVRPVILNPDQPYRCRFCLPAWLGWTVNRLYQAAKRLRLAS